MKDIK